MVQVGQNAWDGSLVPFGDPVPRSAAAPTEGGGNRPVLLALVFVVGLMLAIGLAMLAAGI